MNYSYQKTAIKGIKYLILFGIPFLATNYPEYTNITIGALLTMLYNWAKVGKGLKLP